jgi:hypothetical protein
MNPSFTIHPTALTLNVWSHVAVVRNSGQVRLYVNGNGGSTISAATNLTNTTFRPTIGNYSRAADQSAGQDFQGYVTNVRVANSAIYTGDFIPSRTPFTRTSQGATNTRLLLNHRTSASFLTDSSANNLTVSNTGTVAFNALSPYTEPFVTPPTIVIVSATVTPSTTTVSEGGSVTFTVVGTNTVNGTYYYTIEETAGGEGTVTGSDFSTGSLNGTFTITGNSGSIPLTVVRDLTTEGDESFSVFVRSGSISGPVLGNSPIIDITDSSITPVFTVTPASINEGSAGSFTVANVGVDGTYFFTVLNGTTDNADFTATSGSFTTSALNGSGSFNITTVNDFVTEGAQTFQVQVREGSIGGTVLVTSASVTVNDTSTTVTASGSPTSFNEGSSTTITASATGFPNGTYFYTILNGTTTNADFTATSGSFTVSNGTSGAFTITAASLDGIEGAETFSVQIRTGSTSGTVIATTGTLTINASAS